MSWKHLEHWFIMIWFSVNHLGIASSLRRASNTWYRQNFGYETNFDPPLELALTSCTCPGTRGSSRPVEMADSVHSTVSKFIQWHMFSCWHPYLRAKTSQSDVDEPHFITAPIRTPGLLPFSKPLLQFRSFYVLLIWVRIIEFWDDNWWTFL